MWKNGVLLAMVAAGLGLLLWSTSHLYSGLDGTNIGSQGTVAMTLGIVLTAVVGCGITGFFFWAARRQSREEEGRGDPEAQPFGHAPREPNRR